MNYNFMKSYFLSLSRVSTKSAQDVSSEKKLNLNLNLQIFFCIL